MNWFSHIGRQASRLASLELFRFIGPGLLVTVGFIDLGNGITNGGTCEIGLEFRTFHLNRFWTHKEKVLI